MAEPFELQFAQVKGSLDNDATEPDVISCLEFNHDGELLATGDKGGRVVIFERDLTLKKSTTDPDPLTPQQQQLQQLSESSQRNSLSQSTNTTQSSIDDENQRPKSILKSSSSYNHSRCEYNVYSTFQSHEPEFDYLKSLEIEEKINKIRWLKRRNQAHFLLSTNDKTIKLWKIQERQKKIDGYNLKDESGQHINSPITQLRVPTVVPTELTVEAYPKRVFANAHTYHINSISINSDQETYLSADDLRINLWHQEVTDESFNIVDIKPANMEELTEVITAAEFHPSHCNVFVYSSSRGIIRLCDMRASALCDQHAKIFEEPEDPFSRSFFSEIISSISGIKFSNNGRYLISRDFVSVKLWDINMNSRPVECYHVHEFLRSKLCSLYESEHIFDKFECCFDGTDRYILTGSYNNFFKVFDRYSKRDIMLEASKDVTKSNILKPRKVCPSNKKKKDEISVDSLDFTKKILYSAWHPKENVLAVAATNNLFLFQEKQQ